MTTIRTAAAVGLTTILCAACSNTRDAASSSTPVTRDSAGIRIVEYAALPTDVPEWTLEDSADVTIGETDGDANRVFGENWPGFALWFN